MKTKKHNKCESVYGAKQCDNLATNIVISKGQMFFLCKACTKLEKLQQKANNNY